MKTLLLAVLAGSGWLGTHDAAMGATVKRITPSRGQVGKVAIIHGEGLRGSSVTVEFGLAPATEVKAPNDRPVRVRTPPQAPRDPGPLVLVTVYVDGIPADGELFFEYFEPGPK